MIGESQRAATTTLENAGFAVQIGPGQSSNTVPSGDVISTSPAAGKSEPIGSTVTLTVSTGPQFE